MSVAKVPESAAVRVGPSALPRLPLRPLLILLGFVLLTAFVRLPSFFEPPWHSDEGIFQAVAQRVVSGGRLYADAWESKPPVFLYIYVIVLKLFGPGVLPIRLAAAASALTAELALYNVARHWLGTRASLFAAALLAVLLAVPFWEGNLALTETFAVAPTTLAVLCLLRYDSKPSFRDGVRWLLAAGAMFGLAFLIRQTSAYVAAGGVAWLLVSRREWLRPGLVMAAGSAAVVLPIVALFAVFGSFHWFWDANVVFFFDYVESGRELPLYSRPLTLLPCVLAVAGVWWHARHNERPAWGLPAIWFCLMLTAAMLTGRPYPHYFLQTFPPFALLAAMILTAALTTAHHRLTSHAESSPLHSRGEGGGSRVRLPAFALAASVVALWVLVVAPEFAGSYFATRYTKKLDYYDNFVSYALGTKDREAYNDYFDERVNLTVSLEKALKPLVQEDDRVYIWGEYPWVYPLANATPATPYVTSFYVLLIPYLDKTLDHDLRAVDPRFIVMFGDAWPAIPDYQGVLHWRWHNATSALNALIAERYEQVAVVGRARVFRRTTTRDFVTDRAIVTAEGPSVDYDDDTPVLATRDLPQSSPARSQGQAASREN